MDVHVSWSLAGLNRTAEAASGTGRTEDVAKAGEARDAAEGELEAWFAANGGRFLSGGEPGRATFVLDSLDELRKFLGQLRQRYGAVAAGIGLDSKEADQALQVSQVRGSDTDVVWSPDHAAEIRKSLLEDFLDDLPTRGGPEELAKKISGISPGVLTEPDHYDYSHVLPQHHRDAGYSMSVLHLPWKDEGEAGSTHFDTVLRHRGQEVGSVSGKVRDGALHIDNTTINDQLDPSGAFAYRGKKLGATMYAATMAHAHHLVGAKRTIGGVHSTSASRTHQSLAREHGLDYRPVKVDDNPVGDKDANYGPYEYAIKSELAKAEEGPRDEPAAVQMAPKPPPQTFEQQFHAAAQAQEQTDRAAAQQAELQRGQLLRQVAQVLRAVQQQAPKLEELRQAAPEVYQSVKAMAQAVAQMAQGLRGDVQAMRKAEEWLTRAPLAKGHYDRLLTEKGRKLGVDPISPAQAVHGHDAWMHKRRGSEDTFSYEHYMRGEGNGPLKRMGVKRQVVGHPANQSIYAEAMDAWKYMTSGRSDVEERGLTKKLADLPRGTETSESTHVKTFDYSHLLPEGQKHLQLQVRDHGLPVSRNKEVHPHYTVHVMDGPAEAGSAQAHLYNGFLGRRHMEIHAPFGLIHMYRNKGLGSAMYEALQAHGVQRGGVTHVTGGGHTDAAGKVHERLAGRHGFRYRPRRGGESNDRGPYKYAVKNEEGVAKALDLSVGSEVEPGKFDYSHLLEQDHRDAGYSLYAKTREVPSSRSGRRVPTVSVGLFHGEKYVGWVKGEIHERTDGQKFVEPHSDLDDEHQGRGLGSAMYKAMLTHVAKVHGVTRVVGRASEQAAKIHQRLDDEFGLQDFVMDEPDLSEEDRDCARRYSYRLKNVVEAFDLVKMAVRDNPPAAEPEWPRTNYDYSHLLPPGTPKWFSLRVEQLGAVRDGYHNRERGIYPTLSAKLYSAQRCVGSVKGLVYDHRWFPLKDPGDKPIRHLEPHVGIELDENLRGQKLGAVMYEALFTHAAQKLGVQKVTGGSHSVEVSRVHAHLARKHGMDYHSEPVGDETDDRGSYSYVLKSEPLTHEQILALNPNGGRIAHGIRARIPVASIDGRDPTPANWVDDEGEVRQFRPGQKIHRPIEVEMQGDRFVLWDGNHRVAQAEVNGDHDIDAIVSHPKKLYRTLARRLAKAFGGLPMPRIGRRVNLRLPVGTWDATSGRIKIRKPDGSEVWHQAKVGLIASTSPATAGATFGNPTSGRNPSG